MKCPFGKISVVCFLIVLMLVLPLVTTGCAQGSAKSAPTRDELVAREITALELVCGTSLTPEERQQAAEAVDSGMRGNSEVWLRNYAAWIQLFQRAANDRVSAAAIRLALRLDVEMAKPAPPDLEQSYAIERQIIHAHDATVAFDPKRKHIITESTLRDLYTASAWFAKQTDMPGPSANFMDHLRAFLKTNYVRANDEVAQALANEPQNFLSLPKMFNSSDPQQNAASLQSLRTKLEAAAPSTRDVLLAAAVALVANRAAPKQANDVRGNAKALGYGNLVILTQQALWHFGTIVHPNDTDDLC